MKSKLEVVDDDDMAGNGAPAVVSNEMDTAFGTICEKLALPTAVADDAWLHYRNVRHQCSIKGDARSWMMCAIYSAILTADDGTNGHLSLSDLLQQTDTCALDLVICLRQYVVVADLSRTVAARLVRVCNHLCTSVSMYHKTVTLYNRVFKPTAEIEESIDGTPASLLPFIWTLNCAVHSSFDRHTARTPLAERLLVDEPCIVRDMTDAYHLLLCVFDVVCKALIQCDREDMFTLSFTACVTNDASSDYALLTALHSVQNASIDPSPVLDVKHYYTHMWQPRITVMCDVLPNFDERNVGSVLMPDYDTVMRHVHVFYERAVVDTCAFDERVFLRVGGDVMDEAIVDGAALSVLRVSTASGRQNDDWDVDIAVQSHVNTCLKQLKSRDGLCGKVTSARRTTTAHSGTGTVPYDLNDASTEHYSIDVDHIPKGKAVLVGEQLVHQLHDLLIGEHLRKLSAVAADAAADDKHSFTLDENGLIQTYACPSEQLAALLDADTSVDAKVDLMTAVGSFGNAFEQRVKQLAAEPMDCASSVADIAALSSMVYARRALIDSLSYRLLSILLEHDIAATDAQSTDEQSKVAVALATNERLLRAMYAIAVELVLFVYGHRLRGLYWTVDMLNIDAWYIYPLCELLSRAEPRLPRALLLYLTQLEGRCVNHVCWTDASPLWTMMDERGNMPVSLHAAMGVSRADLYPTSKTPLTPSTRATKRKANVAADAEPPASKAKQSSNEEKVSPRSAVDSFDTMFMLFVRKLYVRLYHTMALLLNDVCASNDLRQYAWTLCARAIHEQTTRLCSGAHVHSIMLGSVLTAAKMTQRALAVDTLIEAYTRVVTDANHAACSRVFMGTAPVGATSKMEDGGWPAYSTLAVWHARVFTPSMRTIVNDMNRNANDALMALLTLRTSETGVTQRQRVDGDDCQAYISPLQYARLGSRAVKLTAHGIHRPLPTANVAASTTGGAPSTTVTQYVSSAGTLSQQRVVQYANRPLPAAQKPAAVDNTYYISTPQQRQQSAQMMDTGGNSPDAFDQANQYVQFIQP